MQLIQDLTLVQKAGVFIGIPLILLFLLVAARRRRSAAAAGDTATTAAAPKQKRERTKREPRIPRRKRRKLAAEAAQAMGTPPAEESAAAPVAAPAPEPVAATEAAPAPEPVAATEAAHAPEPVAAAPPPPVPVVPAPLEDPYVQDTTFADEQIAAFAEETLPEVVVAAPGWPTPGELASSFDPDAFDPLPAAEHAPDEHAAHAPTEAEVAYDEELEQPTGIIEIPVLAGDDHAEHEEHEIAQWDSEFDPATGWGEEEAPVPVAVAAESEEWYDSDSAPVSGAGSSTDQPNPVDLDQFWSEADTEEPWAAPSEVEAMSDLVDDDDPVPDWVHDDEPASWEPVATGEPASAPETAAQQGESGWTLLAPTHGSPVVLDLAGLATSGHPLELVIESNGDGTGVRLRFESPGAAHEPPVVEPAPAIEANDAPHTDEPEPVEQTVLDAELEQAEALADQPAAHFEAVSAPVDAVFAAEPPVTEPEVAEPTAADFDVPFLTGGFPVDDAADEPHEAGDPVIEFLAGEPVIEFVADEPAAFTPDALVAEEPVAAAAEPEPVAEATQVRDVEPMEDPAQILAEIRARLAALDGRS